MNLTRIGIGAAALASAATLGLATTATAAVTNQLPSSPYQVCGNVYTSASNGWGANSAPPSDAVGVSGAQVRGYLFNSSNVDVTPSGLTNPVTTNSNGGYCFQGNSSLVSTVSGGGHVVLEVVSLPGTLTATPAPWAAIDAGTFLSHADWVGITLTPNAAHNFHFLAK